MPIDGPILPKLLPEHGCAAWQLPSAEFRQMDAHTHAEGQLCGLYAGLAVVETDAGSWLCPPGRCVWIPPGKQHSLRSVGRISSWALHLKAEMSVGLHPEPKVLALSDLLQPLVMRVIEWVTEPVSDPAKGRLAVVLKDEINRANEVALHLPVPRDPALRRFAMRLSETPDSSRNFAALAHEVGLSERPLFRGFQEQTGLSPGRWRRQMQILRSLEWLVEGKSFTEVAIEAGYDNASSFARAFRQVVGTTPTTYANRSR